VGARIRIFTGYDVDEKVELVRTCYGTCDVTLVNGTAFARVRVKEGT
jgi:hypothetical protein